MPGPSAPRAGLCMGSWCGSGTAFDVVADDDDSGGREGLSSH